MSAGGGVAARRTIKLQSRNVAAAPDLPNRGNLSRQTQASPSHARIRTPKRCTLLGAGGGARRPAPRDLQGSAADCAGPAPGQRGQAGSGQVGGP
jgi:hypothetical protein